MGRVFDQRDGLGLYCINLVRNMVAQDDRSRYVVWLRTAQNKDLFRDMPNVETHILEGRGNLWWDQVTVPAAARRSNVDLIFNPKFSIPLATRRPCAFVLQDSDWYLNPQNYGWWDNLYIRLLLPIYCRKAGRLLVISQFTLDSLARHGVVRPEKAVVIHAAVGSNFVPAAEEATLRDFRQRHGLPDAFILTATRAYHTGLAGSPPYPGGNNERLIRAYRSYRQRGGRLPLVVAGHRIAEYLRARGFADADLREVRFLGFLPNDQMHLLYQAATFFVLAKLCDSFGLPILEALATGCPAIVPKTCAGPEVAGSAGRLIDPYNEDDIARALLELDGSAERRAELRRLGLARAQGFTWRETARRTLAVLNELYPAAAELPVTRSHTSAN
jgi:glycosyltransferase involved in cell wall biosynthesis